jgi:hypothetical protein
MLRLQVLRDVERQIVDERLVRVIRADDLYTIYPDDIIGGASGRIFSRA